MIPAASISGGLRAIDLEFAKRVDDMLNNSLEAAAQAESQSLQQVDSREARHDMTFAHALSTHVCKRESTVLTLR